MLPNYDRNPNELADRKVLSFHVGINMDNVVLNTRVSFRWRPQIDNKVIKELNDWATGVSDVPAFIITGIFRSNIKHLNSANVVEHQKYRK
jgi:hypothetical protein